MPTGAPSPVTNIIDWNRRNWGWLANKRALKKRRKKNEKRAPPELHSWDDE